MEPRAKRYIAEAVGSFMLIFIGSGSVYYIDDMYSYGVGVLGVAAAFGLTFGLMHMLLAPVSGGHLNPAVSLGMLLQRRIGLVDMLVYWLCQIAGAFLALFALGAIMGASFELDAINNDVTNLPNTASGLALEVILTFVFVMAALRAVRCYADRPALAGLVIGLAFLAVHIMGINMTGASINPARSLATAIYNRDPYALESLWVFIVGPLLGGALAAPAEAFFRRVNPADTI